MTRLTRENMTILRGIRNNSGKGKMFTFIDMFSGIGGFREGLVRNGMKCKGHIEIDKYANISYGAIHDTTGEFRATDITKVRPEDLPQADIYCAGFPCQAFSIAGKQGGFEDTRGTLVFEVLRLAKERKPKMLFFENVKGLLSHDKGKTFATILNAITELGYDVEWQLLNSVNYGVAQNRERVFIIGHLRGQCTRPVFPITGTNTKARNDIDIIAHKKGYRRNSQVYNPNGIIETLDTCQGGGRHPHIVQPILTPNRSDKRQNGRRVKESNEPMFTLTGQDVHGIIVREATKKGYDIALEGDSINMTAPNSKIRRGRVGKQMANTLDTQCNQSVVLVNKEGKRKNKDHYSCLTAGGHSGGNHSDMDLICRTVRAGGRGSTDAKHTWDLVPDGKSIRRLTPLECWRLQGFPDWAFYRAKDAGLSNTQLYKQAGNSVTVNVIEAIGASIKEAYGI